jgi:hypothetical protein
MFSDEVEVMPAHRVVKDAEQRVHRDRAQDAREAGL